MIVVLILLMIVDDGGDDDEVGTILRKMINSDCIWTYSNLACQGAR